MAHQLRRVCDRLRAAGTPCLETLSDAELAEPHRAWVNALPEFLVPVVVETDGQPTTVKLPFDKARIFPYAYRHTYAQRHADAGVARTFSRL
ncbi:hypothetical protein [Kitasatospora sp. NPDC008115]|uniref:hypothetical protein n=1 Tax=Kitasatospora sp. NPDC008115 TaxID=3364022 RepID=UPI0036DFD59E